MDNKKLEQIKDRLLYKKVVEWTEDYIILDDGTKVYVYCSEQDCCAGAYGYFKNVELDAVITDVTYNIIRYKEQSEYDGEIESIESEAVLKLFHNQNVIAQNLVNADAGNGGYYYSVASLVIGDFETDILDA